MPRLMEKKDWMQTVADVGSAENVWYENVSADGGFFPLSVPESRYTRSKKNFWNLYAPIVDYWTLLYNGDAQVVMTARKDNGYGTAVFSDSLFQLFKEGL